MNLENKPNSFKDIVRKATHFIFLTLGIVLLLFAAYLFPRTEVVQLAGTEVKRMDQKLFWGEDLQDVRFIVARDIITGETMMFRNQDFFLPPYFKFDSGDLSGKVMNFENFEPEKKFVITYYGFRVHLFSLYPNATSIKEYTNTTLDRSALFVAIFMLLAAVGLYAYVYRRVIKLFY